jgi:hypothetical protein
VTWFAMHVLLSMLQSILMHVMSLFLRISAAVSNSGSSCLHGLLFDNSYFMFQIYSCKRYIKYSYLLPGLWAMSWFVSFR